MGLKNSYFNVNTWSVQTYNTGSSAWENAAAWPRGSVEPFSLVYQGTTQVLDLASGNKALFTPETRYNYEPLTLTFNRKTVTNTFRTNIKSYLTDHQGLKIYLHDDSSTKLEGYIMSIDESWPLGKEIQWHDVSINFQQFDVDASGSIGG